MMMITRTDHDDEDDNDYGDDYDDDYDDDDADDDDDYDYADDLFPVACLFCSSRYVPMYVCL